ncbi:MULTISPECIES: DUF2818 family protein [Eikenella]|uniref:DUF2818 family protein n=1 Tax=Eikenella TaxID=538 RepID=UPI000B27214A|nr:MULTISPECIES: DUF2818 family protein [Eikenella]
MTAAMYLLLLVALVCANLPFVMQRWFGLKRLPELLRFGRSSGSLKSYYIILF